jgi:hypothetical protein
MLGEVIIFFLETVAMHIKLGAGLAFWFTDKIGFFLIPTKNHLEIEKMLMELLMLILQIHCTYFQILGEKILMVMEYMIKMIKNPSSCWFKQRFV